MGKIKFAHTTTFNVSVHHFWADAIWSTFTWSMPAKVVLHRKKKLLSLLHDDKMWRSFDSGSDIVNVTGVVTQGDE